MGDEKHKPIDDLKQGLNLLFRAAKGAVDQLPTDKLEGALKDGVKEVGKAFESVANEVDKVFHKDKGGTPPPATSQAPNDSHDARQSEDKPFDDAYAPEPPGPGGPRVGS